MIRKKNMNGFVNIIIIISIFYVLYFTCTMHDVLRKDYWTIVSIIKIVLH